MNTRFISVSGPDDMLTAFAQVLASDVFSNFPNSPEELQIDWDTNPTIWFRLAGGSQFYQGQLSIPDKSPVLVRSAVRPSVDELYGNSFRGTGGLLSEAGRNLITNYNPYEAGDKPADTADVTLHTFRRYRYSAPSDEAARTVMTEAAQWLNDNRDKFPGLLIDRASSLRISAGGTGPISDAPIPDEAIPVPEVNQETYLRQPYFERIGLLPKTTDDGKLVFEVHTKARGGGSVIIVVDTAPNSNPNSDGIVWDNVDAIIDLKPEQGNTVTEPPKSAAQKYHGLMVANLCKVVAPDARIILVRAIDDNGHGSVDAIIRIINYLVRNVPGKLTYADLGATDLASSDEAAQAFIPAESKLIFNMSLEANKTGDEEIDIPSLLKAIDDAVLKEAVFVCASGNGSSSGINRNQSEPAAYGYYPGYSAKQYSVMAGLDHEPISEDKYAYPSGFSGDAWKQAQNPNPATDPTVGSFQLEPYNMVIGVASTAKFSRLLYASFSNDGPIAAPAVEILLDAGIELDLPDVDWEQVGDRTLLAYNKDGDYILTGKPAKPSRFVCWSGTSFAAPLVAGQAALLMGARLNDTASLPPHLVKAHIWQTAYNADYWNRPKEINIAASLDAPAQSQSA